MMTFIVDRVRRKNVVAALVAVGALVPALVAATEEGKRELREGLRIAGWIETVRLGASDLDLPAKLDTGADICSVDIVRLREYRKDGKRWVRFAVRDPDERRRVVFERRVVRRARIKQHSGPSDLRPVVEMKFCLGPIVKKVEVNLVDRSDFDYPVLLGRNFLEDEVVVDSAKEHLWDLDCETEDRGAG